jgi:anaerobic magnesium-protoporphyrin IX monomethyl ester cyclase
MSILFIYPPVATWGTPYLGLALLAAHLKSRGITSKIVDANQAFAEAFPRHEAIRHGLRYAKDRLEQLNAKPSLEFQDLYEYLHVVAALEREEQIAKSMGPIGDRKPGLSWSCRLLDIVSRVHLASLPFYPEGLTFEASYISPFCEYSSDDLLASVRSPSLFDGFFEECLAEALREMPRPRIVGISVFLASQLVPGFRCASVIRKLLPDVHITMGGATISCHFRRMKNPRVFDLFDSIVLDEGEVPLETLYRELASEQPQLQRVPSLVWLDKRKVRINGEGPKVPLEQAALPEYNAFPIERYEARREEIRLPVRLSKGCAWAKCSFCMTHLPIVRNYQQASADAVFENLRSLVKNDGYYYFHFVDECPDPILLEALCRRIIDEKLELDFRCHLRFDPRLTLDRCLVYRQAGCSLVNMGLESYNDRILGLMRKGINKSMVDKNLLNFSWSGLLSNCYMMVGFPTETEEEARETYAFVRDALKTGKIARFGYYDYTLLLHSEVGLNPERFEVSEIEVPANCDLDPPVRRFQCSGMSRARAGELEAEFNRHWLCHRPAGGAFAPATYSGNVQVGGEEFRVAYDPKQLADHVRSIVYLNVSHSERLRDGTDNVPAITPAPVAS